MCKIYKTYIGLKIEGHNIWALNHKIKKIEKVLKKTKDHNEYFNLLYLRFHMKLAIICLEYFGEEE